MAENTAALMAENKTLMAENAATLMKKLDKISAKIGTRVDGIENTVRELKKNVDGKFMDLEKTVDEKINEIEEKVNNIQRQPAGPVRALAEVSSRVKTPCFDGSTPFSVFEFQFEKVASRSGWDAEEKALELILALKGAAAEVLETVPASCRDDYEALKAALQRKFGNEHKRDLYRMELNCRMQQANESIQAFAMEIERLIQLAYPGETHPLMDHLKTEKFLNGIRDPEIKLAVRAAQRGNYADTVAFALAQETARIVSKPQVHKIRAVEFMPEKQSSIENIRELLEKLLAEKQQRVKCFNCGKSGHFQRQCRAPRKRARSVSPPRKNKREHQQPPSNESPLN